MIIKAHQRVLRHFIWYGQSNSGPAGLGDAYVGTIFGFDPVDRYSALMFNGGASPNYPGDPAAWDSLEEVAAPIPAGNLDRLVPLANQASLDREGHWMGFAEQLKAYPQINLHSHHGVGGYAYSMLKKGTQPYNNILDTARAASVMARKLGLRYEVAGLPIQHGEADFGSASYITEVAQWRADFSADLSAISGQVTPIALWMTQPCNWAWAAGTYSTLPTSPKSLLTLHEQGKIVLVTPTYHVLHDAGHPEQWIHLSAYGRRLLGEKYAEAMVFGPTWSPLRPILIQAATNKITVSFAGRIGALQFNEYDEDDNPNGVVDPGNKGFRLTNAAGVTLAGTTISSVALINGNTQLQITCSANVPAGTYLGYADAATPPVQSGPIDGPRGCVSDSDPFAPTATTQAFRKTVLGQSDAAKVAPLVNWLVAFNKPVN